MGEVNDDLRLLVRTDTYTDDPWALGWSMVDILVALASYLCNIAMPYLAKSESPIVSALGGCVWGPPVINFLHGLSDEGSSQCLPSTMATKPQEPSQDSLLVAAVLLRPPTRNVQASSGLCSQNQSRSSHSLRAWPISVCEVSILQYPRSLYRPHTRQRTGATASAPYKGWSPFLPMAQAA